MENKLLSHKNKSGQIIKRIAFVPAKISDAHKDDPEKFGLTILNDSLKVSTWIQQIVMHAGVL